MKGIAIDENKCQGHGRCSLIAPDYLELDDTGIATALRDDIPDADLDNVQEAIAACPEAALKVIESTA